MLKTFFPLYQFGYALPTFPRVWVLGHIWLQFQPTCITIVKHVLLTNFKKKGIKNILSKCLREASHREGSTFCF